MIKKTLFLLFVIFIFTGCIGYKVATLQITSYPKGARIFCGFKSYETIDSLTTKRTPANVTISSGSMCEQVKVIWSDGVHSDWKELDDSKTLHFIKKSVVTDKKLLLLENSPGADWLIQYMNKFLKIRELSLLENEYIYGNNLEYRIWNFIGDTWDLTSMLQIEISSKILLSKYYGHRLNADSGVWYKTDKTLELTSQIPNVSVSNFKTKLKELIDDTLVDGSEITIEGNTASYGDAYIIEVKTSKSYRSFYYDSPSHFDDDESKKLKKVIKFLEKAYDLKISYHF